LEVGIQMETKSIEFYQRLARQAHDDKERRFLMSLINEERGHYNNLIDYRNFLIDPADWYYVHEGQHVDGA
jgi:rubrerythrin